MTAGGHCIHQLLRPSKVLSRKLHFSQSVFGLPHCFCCISIVLFCEIWLKRHI